MSLENFNFESDPIEEGVAKDENSCIGNRACHGEVCVLSIDYGFDGK